MPPLISEKKFFDANARYGRNFINNFQMEVANEMYDAIKEGGSTRILGHLMRVPASNYFFAFSDFL